MASLAKFHYDHLYFTPLNCGRFYLHQVGDLCCNSSYEVPEHLHNCYEVSFIESGKALFIINGEEFHVKKNDLILTRIGDSHYIRSSADDPVRYFYFALNFNEESPTIPSLRKSGSTSTPPRTGSPPIRWTSTACSIKSSAR